MPGRRIRGPGRGVQSIVADASAPTSPAATPFEAARRQQASLLRIVRIAFLSVFVTVVFLTILDYKPDATDARVTLVSYWYMTVIVGVALALVVILIDVLTPRKKISTLFSVLFGLIGAIAATIAVGFIIDLLVKSYDIRADDVVAAVKVLIGIGLAYLGIATVLQTQDDFRLVIPYVEFAKQIRGPRPLLLDSSALIDGRFAELADTGLLQSPVIVPRFVVDELRLLADSDDRSRRARGRRGLQAIARLQRSPRAEVTVEDAESDALTPGRAVDQALLDRAEQSQAVIVTTDSGLANIARIRRVSAVNVHELASALRPSVSAGERLALRIVKPGEHPGQGVGYLDDGTMVVVEDGSDAIGSESGVVVTGTLQTAAGRMVFARLAREGQPAAPTPEAPTLQAPGPAPQSIPEPAPGVEPGPSETEASASEEPAHAGGATPKPVRPPGPFPVKPPAKPRAGTPRNPRR